MGAFAEEDVRQGIRAGKFVGTDLGWREGMAAWQPLAQFTEFAADLAAAGPASASTPPPPSPSDGPPPVAATLATAPSAGDSENVAPRSGLPWENREQRGWFNAFIETLQMVLTRPSAAFTAMKSTGGLGDPLIYALIGAGTGAVVSYLFSFGLQAVGFGAGQQSGFGALSWLGAGAIGFVVLMPIFVVLGLFIGAGIIHLCLMMVGGAKQPFETTFRVLAYTQGSVGPLQMVPFCGGVIAGIWGLVLYCIGLARAHEIETGRAILAVFLPVVVCCGGAILLAMLGGLGAMTAG